MHLCFQCLVISVYATVGRVRGRDFGCTLPVTGTVYVCSCSQRYLGNSNHGAVRDCGKS